MNKDKETILITGSAGFIGQHVTREALSRGYRVVGVDLKPYPENLENYTHYELDINSPELENVFNENDIRYVIHLAANSSVPYSVKNPLEDAESNYLGTIRLCNLVKQHNVERMFAASTAALYAHPRYLPVKETHPTNCLSPYAITKQAMEYYITLSGINYTILRFSNVYGPGQNKKGESGVVSIFIEAMKKDAEVKIFGDGKQIRDFIYVQDVVDAILNSIVDINCENKTMNISANRATTINELFYKLKKILDYKQNPTYLPEREGDIKASILDNSLAHEVFGFTPKIDIQTGLEMMLTQQ